MTCSFGRLASLSTTFGEQIVHDDVFQLRVGGRIERRVRLETFVEHVVHQRRFHLAAHAEVLHILDQRVDFVRRQQGERGHRGAGDAVVDRSLRRSSSVGWAAV